MCSAAGFMVRLAAPGSRLPYAAVGQRSPEVDVTENERVRVRERVAERAARGLRVRFVVAAVSAGHHVPLFRYPVGHGERDRLVWEDLVYPGLAGRERPAALDLGVRSGRRHH